MSTFSRRTVLRSGAAVATGMALTGTAAAQPGDQLTAESPKEYDITKAHKPTMCGLLARTIAGTRARAVVVPGYVNGTFVLIVAGKKPYLNMTVTLVPVVYKKQPEYWRIEVVACQPGIGLPTIGYYNADLPLDHCRGTKGVEVVWDDDTEIINVP